MSHRHARAPISFVLLAAVLTISGCQTTAPSTKTEVIAPIPFAGDRQPEGQAVDLGGQVTAGGQAFANATVRVVDATTGEDAKVISPGGGNVVASSGANLKTDADGRFSVRLASFGPGQVVRVMATSGDKTYMTLVSGDGQTISTLRKVQGISDVSNAASNMTQSIFQLLHLTYESTMMAIMTDSALKMAQALTPKASSVVIKEIFDKMHVVIPNFFGAKLEFNLLDAAGVLENIDPYTGQVNAEGSDRLNDLLVKTGNLQTWLEYNRDTLVHILESIRAYGNVRADLAARLGKMSDVAVPGTGITVSLDAHYLTIKSPGGKITTVDVTNKEQLGSLMKNAEFVAAFKLIQASVAGQDAKP